MGTFGNINKPAEAAGVRPEQLHQVESDVSKLGQVASQATTMMQLAERAHQALHAEIETLAQQVASGESRMHLEVEAVSSGMADLSGHLGQLQDLIATAGQQLEVLLSASHTEHPSLVSRLDELDVEAATMQRAFVDLQRSVVDLAARAAAAESNASAAVAALAAKASVDAVVALTERTEAAERSIAALAKRTDALEARTTVWTGHFTQETAVQVAVGGTRDIAITWATPAPSATYSAAAAVSVGAALLGKVTATVKQGSKTKTGCVVTVQNSGLVTLAVGAEVSVIAVG